MLKALHTAATGMAAQETNVGTISNNIANINTTGFKKDRAEFEDLLYQTIQEPGAEVNSEAVRNVGLQTGSGSKVTATRKIHTQGAPTITNNPYDLMISGEGFFGILKENGELAFTRDGAFNTNAQGEIVSKRGEKLFPGIKVPKNISSINIAEDGNIEVYYKNQIEPQNLGKIPVFTFANPSGLKSEGHNLLSLTASSGEPQQNIPGQNNAGFLQQGSIENSNVNIMTEMTDLIKAQRAYEMNSKVMSIADQMLQTINNVR